MRLSHSFTLVAALVIAMPASAQDNATVSNEVVATDANVVAPVAPAATTAPAPDAAAPVDSTRAAPEKSRGMPWGAIGLLGLIGLLGARKAKR